MKINFRSERGQALILIVAGVVAFVALVGLAVDGGAAFLDRREAQAAADNAALTAALFRVRNDAGWQEQGQNIAAENGFVSGVTIYNPPISGYYTGNNEYIQVIIVSTVPTRFGRVIGINELTNTVNAVARAKPPEPTPLGSGHAVVGLAPHDCSAVKYQGNADMTIVGSGIFVNSDCPTAAFFNNSSAAALHVSTLQSVGGITYSAGALDVGTMTSGVEPVPYPPTEAMPNPSCAGSGSVTGNVAGPGSYAGTHFPPNGVDTLAAGVYCVYSADFRVNANQTLVGEDVVIVMMTGSITWNGAANVQLDAPDSGPYKGLLIYMPISNHNTFTMNGDSDSSFTGTILAPGANVKIDGGGGAEGIHSQIIAYTVDLSGGSNTLIVYNANDNWVTTTAPAIELAE